MISSNIAAVQEKINQAAKRANRNAGDVTLITVSKTYPKEAIYEAIAAGANDFGENKVQELVGKIEAIEAPVKWHLIGQLQTNKVKYIVDKVAMIHSVDRIKLAEEISKQAIKKGVVVPILLEVNVAEEASKHGFKVAEVMDAVCHIATLPGVSMKGLMTVAPYVENPEDNREVFRTLSKLSVDIQKQNIDNISTNILSMGMSNDFEVAIEEGANMVRVGSAIFGERDYSI